MKENESNPLTNQLLPSLDQLDFKQEMIPGTGARRDISQYRQEAWKTFNKLPMPDRRLPSWRRTDLRGLELSGLSLAISDDAKFSNQVLKEKNLSGKIRATPQFTEAGISQDLAKKGLILKGLLQAENEDREWAESYLGQIVLSRDGKFASLVNAFANYGIAIRAPEKLQVSQPIICDLSLGKAGKINISHIVIHVREGASLMVVLNLSSPSINARQSLHAGNVEIYLEKKARLKLIQFQEFDPLVWNLTQERAILEDESELEWVFGILGSHLTKTTSEVCLKGEGSKVRSSGFYFANTAQHFDLETRILHQAPSTTSNFIYKGVLQDQSRSIWQGMIFVSPDAIKADGYQGNQNLLLSHQARADSIPALEILENDVQCSHSATMGSIDPDQLFYLESRGVSRVEAEKLIVQGFFQPLLAEVRDQQLTRNIENHISSKLERNG
jgi:Fe-S cluster assembly protein SufD